MSIRDAPLRGMWVEDSGDDDNATAVATRAAQAGAQPRATQVICSYDTADKAVKTITIKIGTTAVAVIYWDFTETPVAVIPLKPGIMAAHNGAISVELEASGTGGQNGRAILIGWS